MAFIDRAMTRLGLASKELTAFKAAVKAAAATGNLAITGSLSAATFIVGAGTPAARQTNVATITTGATGTQISVAVNGILGILQAFGLMS